ncbi:ABC transporter ATP-binding protein, partial [Pseudomonas putida SJ3]
GLDTPLGDRGVTLSGGQRQRLCLARALLGAPDILCLDDATSALDALGERQVLHNIRRLHSASGQGPTLLLITSRLSTLLLADRVLMLENGRITANGSHAELCTNNAHYRDLLGIDHD